MKKKATLLIQQAEAIYTMYPQQNTVIHNASIAVYHDRISAIVQGAGREYIDKDTKIIDARNHIALPGFIDIAFQSTEFQQRSCNSAHQLTAVSHQLLRHGTVLIHSESIHNDIYAMLKHPSFIDLHTAAYHKTMPIVYPLLQKNKAYRRFCISCGYDTLPCLDQWLCAKLYAEHHEIAPWKILAACTRNPATQLQLYDYGILKQGAKANILLFYGNELSSLLHRFYGDERIQIIKDGIRFYPSPIIY